jgi:hypothetical protein
VREALEGYLLSRAAMAALQFLTLLPRLEVAAEALEASLAALILAGIPAVLVAEVR